MSINLKKIFYPRGIFREFGIILTLLVFVTGVWLFIEITDEITEEETRSFDTYMLTTLREPDDLSNPVGPHWIEEASRDITSLGSTVVLTLLVISIAGFLLLKKHYGRALLILSTSTAGVLLTVLFKNFFMRERPDVVPHLVSVSTGSYPSGHTIMAAVIYLSLAAMISHLQDRKRTKIYSIAIALFIVFWVGASRIYLGVHYPTDVLAGWAIGLAWAAFCWILFRYLDEKHLRKNREKNKREKEG